MSSPTSRVVLAACVLCVVCSACDDAEGPPAIRLFIDVEASLLDFIDEVHVSVAAMSPLRRVCEAPMGLFNVPSAEVLPLYIRIERGEEYTDSVMYQISGWRRDNQSVEDLKGWAEWPGAGERDVEVLLDSRCRIGVLYPRCAANQHCHDGRCFNDDVPSDFLDPTAIDVGIPCFEDSPDDP